MGSWRSASTTVSGTFFFCARQARPVGFLEKHGDLRGMKRIGERSIVLERLFKIGQRETRIRGKKSSLRVGGDQYGAFMPATLTQSISEDLQQRSRLIAVVKMKDAARPRQNLKLSGLMNIAVKQNQKLSWLGLPITQIVNVASQQQ